MAIMKCPECGNNISDKAEVCVHCGYPLKKAVNEERFTAAEVPATHLEENVEVEKNDAPQLNRKKKITIAAVIAAVVVLLIIIIAVVSNIQKEKRFQRDFGDVFAFDFEMDIEDIIVYEALTFGNIDYEFDSDVNRLDFAEDDDGEYKHRYFFDDDTGLLTSVYYMDQSIGEFDAADADECEHIKPFKNALLKIIGDWDSDSHDGLFNEAYGNIGGINCKVKYQDGHEKAIFISRYEE